MAVQKAWQLVHLVQMDQVAATRIQPSKQDAAHAQAQSCRCSSRWLVEAAVVQRGCADVHRCLLCPGMFRSQRWAASL